MEGNEYHNTLFALNGQYYGGIEGPSVVKWFKTYDGDEYIPIKPQADMVSYQVQLQLWALLTKCGR